jgi:hypothetical protein
MIQGACDDDGWRDSDSAVGVVPVRPLWRGPQAEAGGRVRVLRRLRQGPAGAAGGRGAGFPDAEAEQEEGKRMTRAGARRYMWSRRREARTRSRV